VIKSEGSFIYLFIFSLPPSIRSVFVLSYYGKEEGIIRAEVGLLRRECGEQEAVPLVGLGLLTPCGTVSATPERGT